LCFFQGIGLISGGPLFLYMLYPIVIAPSEHPFLTAALYLALFELMQLPTAGIYWLVWRAWRLLQVKKAQSGDGSGLLCKLESQQSAVEDEKKNAPILLF
jgi:hypothetical protein